MKVGVVRERQTFERREDGGEIADQATGASAHELSDVGILLLRHDARARRVLVGELRESELRARPKDDLFGEPRRVDRRERRDIDEIHHEVPICDRVDAIAKHALESQIPRRRDWIGRVGHARERSRAEWGRRCALARLRDAGAIATERLHVREKVVRERDRLRSLKVRVPGHDRLGLVARSVDERARQFENGGVELVEPIDREQPQVESDLIVAAARGVELAGDVTNELG